MSAYQKVVKSRTKSKKTTSSLFNLLSDYSKKGTSQRVIMSRTKSSGKSKGVATRKK